MTARSPDRRGSGPVENVLTLPRTEATLTQPAPRRCDLPNCHATVTGRGRRYCCQDHSDKGRNLANAKERAASAERQVLRDALDGKTPPPAHVGFLTTTEGVVLTGQALVELRAALGVLRSAAALADARQAGQLSPIQYAGRLRAVRAAAENAAAAVERLLPGR